MTYRDRIQLRDPVRDRWVKLDTRTGRILRTKRTPGPWANVAVRK